MTEKVKYENLGLNVFIQSFGIVNETNPPFSLASNGMAECKNRTLVDLINALLVGFGAPKNLWGEIDFTTNYVFNRVP